MNERAGATGRQISKRLCQCIGLSSLVLIPNYNDLLSGGQSARMHVPYPLTNISIAQITDILAVGVLLFAVRELTRRTRFYPAARLFVMMFAPPYLIERTRLLIPFAITDGVIVLTGVLWAGVLLLIVLNSPVLYRHIIRIGDTIGIFFAVFGLISIGQLIWMIPWKPGSQEVTAEWSRTPQQPRVHPKIVWIVFDELSYDQLFEHRAHDLTLPSFDRLRKESNLYTDVQPAGYKTVKVIPSLLTGRLIDDIRYRFSDKQVVRYADTGRWAQLTGAGTIFNDARKSGWRTAIVGWYNPYCTVYGDALDSCYWTYEDPLGIDTAQGTSYWNNIQRPVKEIVTQIYSPELEREQVCDFGVVQRVKSYLDLIEHTQNVLEGDQADFVFLHLPVPHPPAIWDRLNDRFDNKCENSYVSSLALADHTLGNIVAILRRSPRWDDTTVVVQGDHSWRINLWNSMAGWTDEDDQASRDEFDPRPALLIHNAGQTQPETDGRALSLLFVHDALEDVLQGKTAQPVTQRPAQTVPATAVVRRVSSAGASSR